MNKMKLDVSLPSSITRESDIEDLEIYLTYATDLHAARMEIIYKAINLLQSSIGVCEEEANKLGEREFIFNKDVWDTLYFQQMAKMPILVRRVFDEKREELASASKYAPSCKPDNVFKYMKALVATSLDVLIEHAKEHDQVDVYSRHLDSMARGEYSTLKHDCLLIELSNLRESREEDVRILNYDLGVLADWEKQIDANVPY